jgi:hypothetical protein
MPPSGDRVQEGPAPTPAPAPAARAPGGGFAPHPVLRLQGMIGNRAVTQYLQRFVMPLVMSPEALEPPSWADMSENERMAAIRGEMDTWWVGPLNETVLEEIWASFGEDLPAVAARHPEEWQKSIDRGAEIADLPPLRILRQQFGQDVVATVDFYLQRNRLLVGQDRERLGIVPAGEEASRIGEISRAAATEELQELALQAADILTAEQALKAIVVGHRTEMTSKVTTREVPVTFDPGTPPHATDMRGRWEEAKKQWDRLQAARQFIGSQSPGVFALMEHGGASPADVATASPEEARAAVARALDRVDAKITETATAIGSSPPDLDWRELAVVHQQLFAGRQGTSGVAWSDPVAKSIAADVVSAYEDHQWWVNMGLATLGAAAFLFSELATGGLATVLWASVGVGIAAGQAGMAWERYSDLSAAAAASASPDTRVASYEQASAARTAAILETVFAFLDLAGGVKLLRAGGGRLLGELSAAARGREMLAESSALLAHLDELPVAEAGAAIDASVRELGAAEAIRRSGKSADELAELVGRESDSGQRLLSQATVSDTGVLGLWQRASQEYGRRQGSEAALRGLDELAGEEAQRAVAEAIDVLGPAGTLDLAGGWERPAGRLDEGGAAARRLLEWREAIRKDLLREFGPERVRATGSVGKLSNDLDVSTLGPNAARDRERVRAWIAARAGGSPDDLRRMLFCDVFTDPLRMHPADLAAAGLGPEVREQISRAQVVRQEQLLMNHRLYEAKAAGNTQAADAIRQEMASLRIGEVRDFRPLTGSERERIGRQIDELHAKLVEAAKAGDSSRVSALVDDIADRQALINVSEGGGYFTGGGTRRYVTEKEGIPGMVPGQISPSQLYGAFVDQLGKLDHAADDLRKALEGASGPEGLESAMRALGKYGERQNEVAGALIRRPLPYGSSALDEVAAGWFDDLAAAAANSCATCGRAACAARWAAPTPPPSCAGG